MPSLRIINPDGQFIKKNQILELKSLFSKENLYTNESIYIINNCERLNKESANTMLKFLEEPSSNVIGFFITNHLDSVIPTIVSRCQELIVNFNNETHEELNITKERYDELFIILNNYMKDIEINNKSILSNNNLSELEKNDVIHLFQLMLKIYESKMNNDSKYEDFNNIDYLDKYNFKNLYKKCRLIIKFLEEINYNVNVDLLLDRFVIEMEGINNEDL